MANRKLYYEKLAATVIAGLAKRQMDGYYFPTAKEAKEKALSMVTENALVSFGGSMTLVQTGLLDELKATPSIRLIDRGKASTEEEIDRAYLQINAITSDGVLVNIDGRGNRVAALIYGPKEVIILAGMNKITPSVEEAVSRVRNAATPPNCIRLSKQTPCAATGACSDCLSSDCICNQIVITRRSGVKGRIKVLLIGESYGF